MSIPLTSVVYPHDPSGSSPANKIINERHELTTASWNGFNLIIPKAGPYFGESITHLIHYPSGERLEMGRDWYHGWTFQTATGEIGQAVYSCICFFDTSLSGHVEIPEYQCLGGPWQLDTNTLQAILAEALLNPKLFYWEYVANTPTIYRPLDHDQDIDTFTELGELLDALREISQSIIAASESSALPDHIAQRNPHGTRPIDIGLGNVMNWVMATLADVADPAALPVERHMNPVVTKAMIENIAISALSAHSASRGNVHGLVAADIDSLTETEIHALVQSYLTGGQGAIGIDAASLNGMNAQELVDQVASGIPDLLDAEIVNVMNDIDVRFNNFIAEDSQKLGGETPNQWRQTIRDVATQAALVAGGFSFFPSVETLIALRNQALNDPSMRPLTNITTTERVSTLIARYPAFNGTDIGPGTSIIVNTGGVMFNIVTNRGDNGGVVNFTGLTSTGVNHTWYSTDSDQPGMRELWVTAPPNRMEITILDMDQSDIEFSDGLTFYGPSSAEQVIHSGRVDFANARIATMTDISAIEQNNSGSYSSLRNRIIVLEDQAEDVFEPAISTLQSEVSVLQQVVTRPAATTVIRIPLNGTMASMTTNVSDNTIAQALNASGHYGTVFSDHANAATNQTYWANKPVKPHNFLVSVTKPTANGIEGTNHTDFSWQLREGTGGSLTRISVTNNTVNDASVIVNIVASY